MNEGTIYKYRGIDGEEEVNVVNEVKRIRSEKIIINFPLDVTFYKFLDVFSKSYHVKIFKKSSLHMRYF